MFAIIIMSFRLKFKKLNILWSISILRLFLPFISYFFFGQIFLLIITVFDCYEGNNKICPSLECKSGTWFDILALFSIISIFLESLIAIITNILYFKPFFIKGSDVLKKTNTIPDISFTLTKIGLNLIFFLVGENEEDQWITLFFAILFTGTNAYFNLKYQNRANKILLLLCNIFSLTLFSGFIILAIGKMLIELEFTGSIYLYFSTVVLISLFFLFYRNRVKNFNSIDSREIDTPNDYFEYIYKFYNIMHNQKNSRNYYTILESLISEIEENCFLLDCPLKKYLRNLKNGNECPVLLYQYCINLFEYGISKFPNDIDLKNNYSIFLVTNLNYKNKALMIINSIKKYISFMDNYKIYRTLKLIENWNFSLENKNNINLRFKNNTKEFKSLIKTLNNLYYDFFSLILESKSKNNNNFNKIHKIGKEIMKNNIKIEELYNLIINEQTDNIEIIKLYCEYIRGVLFD